MNLAAVRTAGKSRAADGWGEMAPAPREAPEGLEPYTKGPCREGWTAQLPAPRQGVPSVDVAVGGSF